MRKVHFRSSRTLNVLMMLRVKIICLLLVAALGVSVSETNALAPEIGMIYYLRSTIDDLYLAPAGDGVPCVRLGETVALTPDNPPSDKFKWKLEQGLGEGNPYRLENQVVELSYSFNQLQLISPPPSCFTDYRNVLLRPDETGSAFEIVDIQNNQCLVQNRVQHEVVQWVPCGLGANVYWEFIQA